MQNKQLLLMQRYQTPLQIVRVKRSQPAGQGTADSHLPSRWITCKHHTTVMPLCHNPVWMQIHPYNLTSGLNLTRWLHVLNVAPLDAPAIDCSTA